MKGLFVITGDLRKSLFVEVVIRILGWWRCGWKNIFLRLQAKSINSFEIISYKIKLLHKKEFCIGSRKDEWLSNTLRKITSLARNSLISCKYKKTLIINEPFVYNAPIRQTSAQKQKHVSRTFSMSRTRF